MKNKIAIFVLILSIATFWNCENNSEEDLIDATPPPPTATINYVENVKPIIDANCIACHSNPPVNGAPNPLTTFEEVRQSTQNNLLQRIALQPGESGFMPLGGTRLPQASIDLIQQWADEGFEEGPNEPLPVSYTNAIKPIIDANCIACHSNPPVNGAPNPLTTFEEVRQSTQNNLLQRIALQPGESGFMPLGGTRLPQASIDLIQQWADEGFTE